MRSKLFFITILSLTLVNTNVLAGSKKFYEYETAVTNSIVPKQVLYALALTESGVTSTDNSYLPWPYTLNWKGKAFRFSDKKEACKAANVLVGYTTAFDIGETQLHWKYHYKAVDNLCDYFETKVSLMRTVEVLEKCYAKSKNWVKAAGCYHRPAGGRLSEIYERKFVNKLQLVLNLDW